MTSLHVLPAEGLKAVSLPLPAMTSRQSGQFDPPLCSAFSPLGNHVALLFALAPFLGVTSQCYLDKLRSGSSWEAGLCSFSTWEAGHSQPGTDSHRVAGGKTLSRFGDGALLDVLFCSPLPAGAQNSSFLFPLCNGG